MSREPTEKEKEWWKKLKKLCRSMPTSMSLYGGGYLCAVDSKEYAHYHEIEHFQPILHSSILCDGGDPWK